MMLDLIASSLQMPEAKLTALLITSLAIFNFYMLFVLVLNLYIHNSKLAIKHVIFVDLFKSRKILFGGFLISLPGLTLLNLIKIAYIKVKS